MWESYEIDLGLIITNQSYKVQFKFTGDCIPQQVEVHSSCGCSNGIWNETTKIVEVMYNPSKIPPQVIGNQIIRKSLKIIYICNGNRLEENLFFKAELINE